MEKKKQPKRVLFFRLTVTQWNKKWNFQFDTTRGKRGDTAEKWVKEYEKLFYPVLPIFAMQPQRQKNLVFDVIF